jgi:hypothetical protein
MYGKYLVKFFSAKIYFIKLHARAAINSIKEMEQSNIVLHAKDLMIG